MTLPEPTPDTATLADRLRNLDLHELCEAWSADQVEMTDSSAERYGAAHDAVSTVIDEAIDALAAAEQQTADLRRLAEWQSLEDQNIALLREAADKLDGLITSLAKAETARDEANTERWRMKETLDRRTAQFDKEIAEAADDVTRLAAERNAARVEVAELTQQRDQAVADVAERIATAIEAAKPSTSRFWDTADAARVYALNDAAKIARALAVRVPAGDTSHDETCTTTADGIVICPAWHYVKAYTAQGTPHANPEQCALHEPHTVHKDRAGDSDGRWFTRGESQYAMPMEAAPAPVAAHAGQDETGGAM